MTKFIKLQYHRFLHSSYTDIYSAYKNPSDIKVSIWERYRREAAALGSYNIKVLSRNCFTFSLGFTYCKDDKKYFRYISPAKDITVEVE